MGKKTGPTKPNKQDKATITKLLSLIKIDASVEEACAYARIHYNTFYNWFADPREILWEFEELDPADPTGNATIKYEEACTFKELVEQARAFKYVLAKKTLFGAVQMGNITATVEFLKRRSADYFDKQVTIPDKSALVQDITKDLKDAKTRQLRAERNSRKTKPRSD